LLGLTNKNPHKRLGIIGGASQIKNHKFFSEVNWDDVKNKKLKPPIVPQKK
jgi:protein-serine/threonine kinase